MDAETRRSLDAFVVAVSRCSRQTDVVNKIERADGPSIVDLMGAYACDVPLGEYVSRFLLYARLVPADLACASLHLRRLSDRGYLCPRSLHRAVAGVLVCVYKFNHDVFFSNATLARIAGVKLAELNRIELRVLSILEWKLYLDPAEVGAVLKRWSHTGSNCIEWCRAF